LKDAEIILDFLIHEIKIPAKNIFLFGRSVGTGPAVHLASQYEVGCLILVSAYTSMKKLIGDHFGKVAKWLFAERFENLMKIDRVKCPTLFIHGNTDELIPVSHSIDLKQKIHEEIYSELFISKNMTHNR